MSAIQFQSGGDCSPQPLRRGWRPRRGCGASCSAAARAARRLRNSRGHSAVGFGSDSPVMPVQNGMCKVTLINGSWSDPFLATETFSVKVNSFKCDSGNPCVKKSN